MCAHRHVAVELTYGGQITDERDARCLRVLISEAYASDGLQPGFPFAQDRSATGSFIYSQPAMQAATYEDLMARVHELPLDSTASAVGLDGNATLSRNVREGRELLGALNRINGGQVYKTSGNDDEDGRRASGRVDEDARLGSGVDGSIAGMPAVELGKAVQTLIRRLPAAFDLTLAQKLHPSIHIEPLDSVLHSELVRYNRLSSLVRESLETLQNALIGDEPMPPSLHELGTSVVRNETPRQWHELSYPSLEPLGSYYEDLLRRLAFFQGWVEGGRPPSLWLPAFFAPRSVLTALLQRHARKHALSLSTLRMGQTLLPDTPTATAPADGVHVHGLYLEGARFDAPTQRLVESEPNVLSTSLPTVWLCPAAPGGWPPSSAAAAAAAHRYPCPLYATAARRGEMTVSGHSTNFIMDLMLPSDAPESYWIRRGVAALCQTVSI